MTNNRGDRAGLLARIALLSPAAVGLAVWLAYVAGLSALSVAGVPLP